LFNEYTPCERGDIYVAGKQLLAAGKQLLAAGKQLLVSSCL